MKFSKMMKIINKSLKSGITEINKADAEFYKRYKGNDEAMRYYFEVMD